MTPPPSTPDAEAPQIHTQLVAGPVPARSAPPAGGGVCVFLGTTRAETHPTFGPLIALDYEAYEPMAQRQLDQLARQAAETFGCLSVHLEHATGPVPVGQASVRIQVATPHRDAAFTACRWLIDTLKEQVPIWKHEQWTRGTTYAPGSTPAPGSPPGSPPGSSPGSTPSATDSVNKPPRDRTPPPVPRPPAPA